MQGTSIVFDTITVRREGGIAFDTWHQNHYVPSVLGAGQILNVQCYGSPLRATYVSVFESNASPTALHGVLPAPEHDAILSTERHVAGFMNEQIAPGAIAPLRDAPILYPVLFGVPAAAEEDFNAWYDKEHLGILLRSVHWPMCRRFKIHKPVPGEWTHIALHYLADMRALESKERSEARATPWRDRLAKNAWFKGDYRVLYKIGARRTPQ